MNRDKDEIYDVLKDNPRWAENKDETNENKTPKKISTPEIIKEDEDNIADVKSDKASKSDYLFDDSKTELREENKTDLSAEEYLKQWKNEDTEKKNEENFRKELEARKNEDFAFTKSNSKKIKIALWLIAVLVVLLSAYCIISDIKTAMNTTEGKSGDGIDIEITQSDIPELDTSNEYVDENGKYTVEGVAEVVRPAIVDINCFETKDDYVNKNVYGTGSGIIIREDGYIVTNAHVLEDASVYSVSLSDDREYVATLVGKDSKTDLAVLKIDVAALPTAEIGDSDKVVVGEEVVAIGNPAGLSGTVTNGIVSALNRQIRSEATGFDMDCIQTNAAISPGNSGGALVNMYGQVIGITSSKYANSNYEGLGFAVSINQALPIINQLINYGYVEGRVKIGIKFSSMEDENAKSAFMSDYGYKIPDNFEGLWITEISEDCDIANTELQVNDFIISIEGKTVSNYNDLYNVISNYSAGDSLTAKCVRFDESGNETDFEIEFKLSEDTSGEY